MYVCVVNTRDSCSLLYTQASAARVCIALYYIGKELDAYKVNGATTSLPYQLHSTYTHASTCTYVYTDTDTDTHTHTHTHTSTHRHMPVELWPMIAFLSSLYPTPQVAA